MSGFLHADDKILIDKQEYEQLLNDQRLLRKLKEKGVDNWICYDDVMRELDEEGW